MNVSWVDVIGFGAAAVGANAVVVSTGFAGADLDTGSWFILSAFSLVSSGFSAGFQMRDGVLKNWRSALANTILGAFVGVLLAHMIIVPSPLNDAMLISGAPLLSLGSAKFARHWIRDDVAFGEFLKLLRGAKE